MCLDDVAAAGPAGLMTSVPVQLKDRQRCRRRRHYGSVT